MHHLIRPRLAVALTALVLAAGVQAPIVASAAPAAPVATSASATSTTKLVRTYTVPFTTKTVKTQKLASGVKKTVTAGRNGVRTKVWRVVAHGTKVVSRTLVSDRVTQKPVTRVVWLGVGHASSCDPNYSGACVPIASDVDCAGGSGNGPAYVEGPVTVIGVDIYGLDGDGNGVGCQ